MMSKPETLRIACSACGEETFAKSVPVYENFRRTGEQFVCVSCGFQYASADELPRKEAGKPRIFGKGDLSPWADIFSEEDTKNCRHCVHYTVNPFTQRCGLHEKTVKATDVCEDFSGKDPDEISDDNGRKEK
ncbi:MAG: hypothetical protein R6V03_07110 [Kiritimatiellia bacterium]